MENRHLSLAKNTPRREISLTAREILADLSFDSKVPQRIKGLGRCGIGEQELCEHTGVEPQTYQAFAAGTNSELATPHDEIIIDDVRQAASLMLQNGFSPEQVGRLMISQVTHSSREELIGKTLLQALVTNPMQVTIHLIEYHGVPFHDTV